MEVEKHGSDVDIMSLGDRWDWSLDKRIKNNGAQCDAGGRSSGISLYHHPFTDTSVSDSE